MRKRTAGKGTSWKSTIEDDHSTELHQPDPVPHPAPHVLPTLPLESDSLEAIFTALAHHLESRQAGGSAVERLNRELLETRLEHARVVESLSRYGLSSGVRHSEYIWRQKQVFTELIDFIDYSESVDLADVNPEYLSLAGILDRIRSLQMLNPLLYEKSRLGISISPLFEFFCSLEMSSFSFKSPITRAALP
jgi:hypothetical protein